MTTRRAMSRRVRGVAGLAGVAMFLLGGNFCLIGSLAGAPMSCLALPAGTEGAGSGSARAPHSGCGHGPMAGQETPATTSSCCITILQNNVPSVAKAEPDLGRHPALAAWVPAARVADVVAPRPLADESPPLDHHPPAPHRGRAPPLS